MSDARGVRTMHVGGEAIQSSMRLDDPWALALDYTRCMMTFLLFHPEPRRALMIGLGGGSLAKFFHRNLKKPRSRRRARRGARGAAFRAAAGRCALFSRGDGVEALRRNVAMLVLDAFQDELHVPQLASAEFYDGAFLALTEPGALVVNFMNDDPKFDLTLQRLERAFGGAVLAMPALYDPNILVFALKGVPSRISFHELKRKAEDLEARIGLPFTRYVNRLRAMNPCTPEELIVAG